MTYWDRREALVVALMFSTGPLAVFLSIVGWFAIKRLVKS
jgi:hypothetical protein